MAKMKVYELARDLNVTVKALLDMMKRIGINAKSHMSALDDESVHKFKQSLFYNPDNEVMPAVKPTVIRRRKKIVVVTQDLGGNISQINYNLPGKIINSSERIESLRKKYRNIQSKHGKGHSPDDPKTLTDLSSELKIPAELKNQTKEPELDDRTLKKGFSDKNDDNKREVDSIKGKTFVIDGLNVCRDFFQKRGKISLKPLATILTEIMERNGNFICIFDANAVYVFKERQNSETNCLEELLQLDDYFCLSTGRLQADDLILNRVNKTEEPIISNDKYLKYVKKYPWIEKHEERLIKGKIIGKDISVPYLDIYRPLCTNLKKSVKDLIVQLS